VHPRAVWKGAKGSAAGIEEGKGSELLWQLMVTLNGALLKMLTADSDEAQVDRSQFRRWFFSRSSCDSALDLAYFG
jgi:hypothetical protein